MNADPFKPPTGKPTDLDALGVKVAKGRQDAGLSAHAGPTRADAALGDGLRVAIEFVVSTLVGAGLGWFLGGFLGSAVIGLLVGLLLGFAAGLRGVYRGMMSGTTPGTETDGNDASDG